MAWSQPFPTNSEITTSLRYGQITPGADVIDVCRRKRIVGDRIRNTKISMRIGSESAARRRSRLIHIESAARIARSPGTGLIVERSRNEVVTIATCHCTGRPASGGEIWPVLIIGEVTRSKCREWGNSTALGSRSRSETHLILQVVGVRIKGGQAVW